MDADAYFETCRARVEAALLAALPPEGRRPARLTEAIRYSVTTGGKRVRPMLCLAAAEAAGGIWSDAVPPAVAIELLHTYTLVHDDLPCMDNDLLRRGMPTVHAKFGEAMAVLCGDALQACAFGALTCGSAVNPARVTRWVCELAHAAGPGGVVGGQVEDVADAATPDPATVAFVHQHKTADLFRAALRMGAIGGNATEVQIEQLGRFGNHLGLAFQIVDDLLDAGSPDAADELSCLKIWSPAEARQEVEHHTAEAIKALTDLPGPTEPLRHMATRLATRVI
ncbi:MAG: polyprenyl synthetase family protein [Lentisphaerae bacterium]|jgi:geranylgeranyl diphosphate synthase type II|nr:polyprenyl synthetase family protein [Lentisphaerota bacterium]